MLTCAAVPQLPKLLTPPLSAFNCQAIATLSEVAGAALNRHLSTMLPVLMMAMTDEDPHVRKGDAPTCARAHSPLVRQVASTAQMAAETVVLAVSEDGVHQVMLEIIKALKHTEQTYRLSGCVWSAAAPRLALH